MTDYYTYSPNPIVLNNGSTFQLTYNAFEILRPIGPYKLYNSSNVLLSTFQPIAPFITGYGLYNPISIDFDNSGNMYALCDVSTLTSVSHTLSMVIIKRDSTNNNVKSIVHTLSTTPPTSLAIDNKNYLYVCYKDTNQGYIAKYDFSGNEIFSSNGIDHFLHALPHPTSVTFDTSNNLYIILDSNAYGTMVKYDPSGNQIVSFTSPNNTSQTGGKNFKILFACYLNSYLYVCFSESSTSLFHIHKFTTNGIYVADMYTTSKTNLTAGILTTDNSQNIYFTNYNSNTHTGKFIKININSPYTATIYDVSGNSYFSSSLSAIGYNPQNSSFYTTINPDQKSNLIHWNTFLSDTVINNLALNNTNSTITTSVYYDASIKPNYPQYLVFDSNNNIFYVTDIASLNVLKIVSGQSTPFILQSDIQKACYTNYNQHIVTSIAGIVLYNNQFYISATCTSGNGVTDIIILSCSISSPNIITVTPIHTDRSIAQGMVMDLTGQNLYLSSTHLKNNGKTDAYIMKYNIATGTKTQVDVKTNSDNTIFYGLAFDVSGNLYAALNKGKNVDGTIMKYNSPNFSGSQTYISSYLDISNNVQNLTNPTGIVFDSLSNLYISCTDPYGNGIVVQNNHDNLTTTLFAQSSDTLIYPVGIALNNLDGFPTGDLYIACQNNHSIVKAYTHNIIYTDIPTTDLSLGVNYLHIDDPYNLIDISVNAINLSPCFGENSQILIYCQQDNTEKYQKICELRPGDLIKTYEHGYVPIKLLGVSEIVHPANQEERIREQLYVCSPNHYPEIFEDLILTGCHSILIDMFKSEQEYIDTRKVNNGRLFVTDKKYRLPACVDDRATVYDNPGTHTIYHLALYHTDPLMNYGIYANGLLVETCSIRFMKEYSNMKIIE